MFVLTATWPQWAVYLTAIWLKAPITPTNPLLHPPLALVFRLPCIFFFAACRLTRPLSLEKMTHRWFPTTVSRHHQLTGRNISDFTLLVWKLLSLYCIKIIKYFLNFFYSRWLCINSKKKKEIPTVQENLSSSLSFFNSCDYICVVFNYTGPGFTLSK